MHSPLAGGRRPGVGPPVYTTTTRIHPSSARHTRGTRTGAHTHMYVAAQRESLRTHVVFRCRGTPTRTGARAGQGVGGAGASRAVPGLRPTPVGHVGMPQKAKQVRRWKQRSGGEGGRAGPLWLHSIRATSANARQVKSRCPSVRMGVIRQQASTADYPP